MGQHQGASALGEPPIIWIQTESITHGASGADTKPSWDPIAVPTPSAATCKQKKRIKGSGPSSAQCSPKRSAFKPVIEIEPHRSVGGS